MNFKQIVMLAIVAGAMTLTGVLPVEAAPAVVTGSVNVHSRPDTDSRVVGRLRRGERVNVTRCAPSRRWCFVQSRRTRNGWVNSRFLDRVRGSNRQSGICFYGSRGQVCLNL
jgi:uncharacterized protein YraI